VTCKDARFLPTTINRRLASLISFYTYLSDEDPELICPCCPAAFLRERERLPRPVQEDGLRAFFAAIENTLPPKASRTTGYVTGPCSCSCSGAGSELARWRVVANPPLPGRTLPRLVAWGKARVSVRSTSPAGRAALRPTCVSAPRLPTSTFFSATRWLACPPPPFTNGSCSTARRAGLAHRSPPAPFLCQRLLNADVPVTTIQKLWATAGWKPPRFMCRPTITVANDYYAACTKLEGWS